MKTKLKVGDKVLHVSGANCNGYDNKEGTVLVVDTIFGNEPCITIDFGNENHIYCYALPKNGRTLDLRLLNPPDGENV